MQKKSKIATAGFYDPINLPKDFPVTNPAFRTPPLQSWTTQSRAIVLL